MKSKYWYVHGSDIIGNGDEEKKVLELRAQKRKAKVLRAQKKRF